MTAITPVQWLSEAVTTIPLRTESLFQQLWPEGRLRYVRGSARADTIDRANAQLVSSTTERALRLLLILPDQAPQRAPLLLATALVSQWWDRRKSGLTTEDVVYFGTTIGIRSHLAETKIGGLALDTVFRQSKPASGASSRTRKSAAASGNSTGSIVSELPKVVCVYSPADPVAVLEDHKPKLIVIDCGNESRIRWLQVVLEYAEKRNIPVLAWSYNPFSEVIRDFQRLGQDHVFRWPYVSYPTNPELGKLNVSPMVMDDSKGEIEHCLQESYRALSRATAEGSSGDRLALDALRVSWRVQRAIEQLCIPFDLHESEAHNYWGITPITRLLNAAERFQEALSQGDRQLRAHLEEALSFQRKAIELLKAGDPPVWAALVHLCVDQVPEDRERLILFPNEARKHLFALALLARHNISENDLSGVQVALSSLTDLHRRRTFSQLGTQGKPTPAVGQAPSALPLLTVLPSVSLSSRLLPVLHYSEIDILMYSYQAATLAKRAEEWNHALDIDPIEAQRVISSRAGTVSTRARPPQLSVVKIAGTRVLSVSSGHLRPPGPTGISLETLEETREIAWLLGEDDSEEEGEETNVTSTSEADEPILLQEAIEFRCSGGWRALFALDDTVNVISEIDGKLDSEERFVRAVRPGDRVLFIHGQRRQSLYELIVSRVHNHPAIEIHLALIRKWQDDFAQSYRECRAKGCTAEDVLAELRARGSSLISPQTIRLWLNGRILSPDDPKDLSRLADSMGMAFVKQYHARIYRAAQRIRGLHRGLSLRLNRWLRDQAAGREGTDAALEVFDEELGLSLQDFRDSLMFLRVQETKLVQGPFLRRSLGAIERVLDS